MMRLGLVVSAIILDRIGQSIGFSILPHQSSHTRLLSTRQYSTKSPGPKKRARSRVSDPFGKSPDKGVDELEELAPEDIPELEYDENNRPIPHQPWRRGITAGCEDPIDSPWRQQAEEAIDMAVEISGGRVVDITWYLTSVVITLDEDLSGVVFDPLKDEGPAIEVVGPEEAQYYDPANPNPEDVILHEVEGKTVWERDFEAEEDIRNKTYAETVEGDEERLEDPYEGQSIYADTETWEDERTSEFLREEERLDRIPQRINKRLEEGVDKSALSTIAGAIIEILEDIEEEVQVLARHEIILAAPGPSWIIETQKQFDNHRGQPVVVETQDPWNSNRVLKGRLVDRNSMDVYINKRGNLVTIPLNFVKCVRLPSYMISDDEEDEEGPIRNRYEDDEDEEEFDEDDVGEQEDYDYEYVEEEVDDGDEVDE